MTSFNRIALELACIAFLALVIVPHVAVGTNAATSAPLQAQTYQYQTVLTYSCNVQNEQYTDLCTTPTGASIESVLNTYSSQGYQLFAVSSAVVCNYGENSLPCANVYTLRAPVTGGQKASPAQ
ncbi:MAG: hypothetical protein ABSB87_09495 [Terriglobales bacterium]|jgi:hypothetical protein